MNAAECTNTLSEVNSDILRNMFSCDFRDLKAKMDATTWGMKREVGRGKEKRTGEQRERKDEERAKTVRYSNTRNGARERII